MIRLSAAAILLVLPVSVQAANWTLVGWNNLGMHCMDDDFSIFSLLPPYNTIHAQLTDTQGRLITDPATQGITVTYEAYADPDGSINTTSANKTNFWSHLLGLFGVSLPVDVGLAGKAMPGSSNTPQPMTFDAAAGWFIAEGIPITPYDDGGTKNYYPMMHLAARNNAGVVLATTDIVLPVSDEMDCKGCHSSGAGAAAQPADGWAFDADPRRDVRLNILRLHDDRQAADPTFQSALGAFGYNAAGLSATVTNDGRSILCASCHASAALGTSGHPGTMPLTQAMHALHGTVTDPTNGLTLESSANRSACYRCHPGSVTRCLRGVMGAAVASDGSLAIQCQSCHGAMSEVGAAGRSGWFDEPTCQNCHTGTAVSNNGQIRYTSVFDSPGHRRVAADTTFATNPDTPLAGVSLYRFSTGHGGIKCEGCHGSTHAEFPASHRNDNIQSIEHQGHVGMLVECTSCHPQSPATVNGGPHGMHPVGSPWVNSHADVVERSGAQQCRVCHGSDYRGTVLSRSKADRLLSTELGSKYFWRGFQVGCYTCHQGPSDSDANPNRAPVSANASVTTAVNTLVSVTLAATDPDRNAVTLRIVSQPAHGTVGLNGTLAQYFPDPNFAGVDSFTFAAWDGSTDSNLATITVGVGQPVGTPTSSPSNGTPTPTAATPHPTPTTAAAICPPLPSAGCRSGRSALSMRRDGDRGLSRLRFNLTQGQSTSSTELGDPTRTTVYALCVYDATGRVLATQVGAGGTCGTQACWRKTLTGYLYANPTATPPGITSLALKSSAINRSHALIVGKGGNLRLPALPLQGTVTAQLTNSAGVCFGASYRGESIHLNDGTSFTASAIAP